jgi:hypothetical protein
VTNFNGTHITVENKTDQTAFVECKTVGGGFTVSSDWVFSNTEASLPCVWVWYDLHATINGELVAMAKGVYASQVYRLVGSNGLYKFEEV